MDLDSDDHLRDSRIHAQCSTLQEQRAKLQRLEDLGPEAAGGDPALSRSSADGSGFDTYELLLDMSDLPRTFV